MSITRTVVIQTVIASIALAQGGSVRRLWHLTESYESDRGLRYALLALQWALMTFVVRRPRPGNVAAVAIAALVALHYAPGAPPDFVPLWIAGFFVPLAAQVVEEAWLGRVWLGRVLFVRGLLVRGLVSGRRFWRSLALGLTLTLYGATFLDVYGWALFPTAILVAVAYKRRLAMRLALLGGALGLDVFIGRVWFLYGSHGWEVHQLVYHACLESWEAWATGITFLAVATLVMNHPRLGGEGHRLWARQS